MNIDKKSLINLIDRLHEGLYITNLNKEILYWNSAAESITGFKASEILGYRCCDNILVHIDDNGNKLCSQHCPLNRTIKDKKSRSADVFLHHKNGYRVPVHVEFHPLYDKVGKVNGVVEYFSPINDKHGVNINEKIRNELFDKKFMIEELKRKFKNNKYINEYGIIRFDIDNLSYINVKYGKKIGDKILNLVSSNIFTNSSKNDIFGRWVDDEFIGIISSVNKKELETHAELLRLTTEHSYIDYKDEKISVTLSIGATMIRSTDYYLTMMERVDKLLYISRKSGGNCINIG